jgi:nucleoid DNA-binding protein
MTITPYDINDAAKSVLRETHEKNNEPEPEEGMELATLLERVQQIIGDTSACTEDLLNQVLFLYRGRQDLSIREINKLFLYWIKQGNDRNSSDLSLLDSCGEEGGAASVDIASVSEPARTAAARAATGRALTKQEIIDSIAKHTELTETDVEKVLDSLVRHIHWSVSPEGPGKFSLVRLLTATVVREPGKNPEVEIKAGKRLNDMAKTNLDET